MLVPFIHLRPSRLYTWRWIDHRFRRLPLVLFEQLQRFIPHAKCVTHRPLPSWSLALQGIPLLQSCFTASGELPSFCFDSTKVLSLCTSWLALSLPPLLSFVSGNCTWIFVTLLAMLAEFVYMIIIATGKACQVLKEQATLHKIISAMK